MRPAQKLWRYISRHPLWSAILASVVVAAGGTLLAKGGEPPELPVAGFGPSRPHYWCKRPSSCDGANHVVFNSYVNAPNYGDERDFVNAKPAADETSGDFYNVLTVEPEETVLIRLYVNNSAWTARLRRGDGIARGTRARVRIPLSAGTRHYILGFIRASNARPSTVWDGVVLESEEQTVVRYEFDSARWWAQRLPGALHVSDALMEEGTPIGSWGLDGRFGHSFGDGGLLTFRVRIESVASA
ncbi:MAG TPA: hypothetical protein VFZ19_07815 [Solirubrobacterales bacterium]